MERWKQGLDRYLTQTPEEAWGDDTVEFEKYMDKVAELLTKEEQDYWNGGKMEVKQITELEDLESYCFNKKRSLDLAVRLISEKLKRIKSENQK